MSMFPLSRLPHVHPVAASDYFGKTWFMRMLAGMLFNGIPIDRKKASGADPLRPIADALADGESLVFFPEGSRGEAGVVAPFRQGIGRLVQSVPGVLVLPVYMSGPERIWPRGQTVPVPSSIDVSIGKPRVYPHDSPAPEIADQVRRDVLPKRGGYRPSRTPEPAETPIVLIRRTADRHRQDGAGRTTPKPFWAGPRRAPSTWFMDQYGELPGEPRFPREGRPARRR